MDMTMVYLGQALHDMGEPLLSWGLNMGDLCTSRLSLLHSSPSDWILLAQQFDTDPFSGVREWFSNLIATGQIWALIIGFIVGYLFRGLTSYG